MFLRIPKRVFTAMDSALSAAASLTVRQGKVNALPTSSPPSPSLNTSLSSARACPLSAAPLRQKTACALAVETSPLVRDPDSILDFDGSEGSSCLDRRGMAGSMRSVEVLSSDLVAFGRTILTDVPPGVTVGPCKLHEGSGAADTPGTFLGCNLLESSSRHSFSLGLLRGLRFLSCFRFKLWWMTQRVGTHGHEIPYETQFLLIECPPLSRAALESNGACAGGGRGRVSNQAVRDSDPVYVVMLPVLEGSFRSSLQGGFDDELEVCVESGDPSVTSTAAPEAVYVHAGRNPFRTISEAVRAVEAHSGSFVRREQKMLPGLLDHFGWCTWDAFYTDVTAQGVNEGLESLAGGGVPAKFLIIDDGWQTVSHDGVSAGGVVTAGTQYASRLACVKENTKFKASASFKSSQQKKGPLENGAAVQNGSHHNGFVTEAEAEAEAEAAIEASVAATTNLNVGALRAAAEAVAEQAAATSVAAEESRLAGLGELVQQVKATHEVKFVYVWHALLGYWGGVTPGPHGGMERFEASLTYPKPSHGVLANQPDMAEDTLTLNGMGLVAPWKAFHFYDELHSYLASCGVDGVKVDVQNILETLGAGHGGRVALAKEYHSALESSIRKNFRDNGIISCMSHNTDALYLAKQTAVMRASDDFWPTDPASHTVHIISVAYNSLFLGEFMQPDWDMFQSIHPAAEFHGAARAAGGCAVYVSDKPHKHDFSVLKKLVNPDGTILRARLPGRPTKDCLFVDPARDAKSLLKVWNLNFCNGLVTAFNCQGAAWCRDGRKYTVLNPQPGTVTGVVSAEDVDYLADVAAPDWNGDVVVYCHFADELISLPDATSLVVSLPPLQCEVYTMAPIKVLGETQFAPIGFGRMYNAGGAVLATEYSTQGSQCNGGVMGWPTEDGAVEEEVRHRASVSVRGGGQLLVYASARPLKVSCDGSETPYDYNSADGRLSMDLKFSPQPRKIDFVFC